MRSWWLGIRIRLLGMRLWRHGGMFFSDFRKMGEEIKKEVRQ